MSTQRDSESLLRALAEEGIPPESAEALQARRELLVPGLAHVIRQTAIEREKRLRLRRAVFGAVAAAAVAVFSAGSYQVIRGNDAPAAVASAANVAKLRSVTGTLVMTQSGRARVITAGEEPAVRAGDALETAADGGAELKTERSAIQLRRATQLTVLPPSSAEERVRLAVGRIDLNVTKHVRSPRSVVVETPNAEVVVRGTVFSVDVGKVQGVTNTRVSVSEGSVWVLHAGKRELVSTGEEWSSDLHKGARSNNAQAVLPQPVSDSSADSDKAVAVPPPSARSRKMPGNARAQDADGSGTLADENRMFQVAVDARNRGEDRKAVDAFGALLGRYPGSRLAEEARVERMRALRRLGDTARASAEARRYLSEHASGFAREEARSTALGEK